MISGLEYVLVAYGIWLFIFVIYIFINKRSIKNLNDAIAAFEERNSVSTNSKMILDKNESKK